MKRIFLLTVSILFLCTALFAQQSSLYFASYPTLTPDGNTLIYSYNGNLWRASADGGFSTQITSMQGNSSRPKVSPDGKWLAFSNAQFGNNDLYIMPVQGGAIKRLTYHSGDDQMESWSWDNEWVYFTSNRFDRMASYKVRRTGGTPVRVFSTDNFDYTHDVFEHPQTGELFFDDTWESSNFYNRIGYKGAFNPEIQSYNFKNQAYKKYTDWTGKDMSVTIDKNGQVYFISDEANGQYNLYTFKDGKKTNLTKFKTSVMHPFVSASGDKIVFEKDFQLYSYIVSTGKSSIIPLQVYTNNTLSALKSFNVSAGISDFNVSPDGKKLAFVSRGRLFVSDNKGKFVKELDTKADERVDEVHWLADNITLIYTRTNKGFKNLFVQKANGEEAEKQVSNQAKNDRSLAFNSDKTKAAYLSGNDEVRMLDLKSLKTSLLAKDEIWGLNSSTPYFSPDDKYVMFTAIRNFEQDILLFRLADNQVFNITNTGVTEQDPVWSPDGKYIFFTSDRTHPAYPYGLQEGKIYRMALEKMQEPYRSDRFDSLFTKKEKDSPGKTDTAKKGKEKEGTKLPEAKDAPKKPVVNINFDNLMERLEQVGPSFGSQSDVQVIQDGDKTHVLFVSNHEKGSAALWQVTYEPFEETKTEKVKGADGFGLALRGSKDNYYLLVKGSILKLNLNGNSTDKIDISFSFPRNLTDEFNQMFYEAWAVLAENYYDVKFNNVDWEEVKTRYSKFLPYLQTRGDIRALLNNMMGELNTSHYGFSTFGSEESTYYRATTAAPGIMFSYSNPYQVDFVVPNGVADFSGSDVRKGDVLVSVDGKSVDPALSREFYFSYSSLPDEIVLGFKRGDKLFDVKIHPSTYTSMQGRLYDAWEDANRQRVNALSKNRIGYVYMKDMSTASLEKFRLDMVSDSVSKKDALILDLRYNTGGNVHDEVLQFLSRRPYLQWKYRNGKISPQPNFAPAAKPIILLINEQTLSDGEMTAAGFKELKLGTVIGTETYRWIIFTTSARLVDGSMVRLPSWGCYTLDGKDLEKNGVSPDIFIKNTFEDRLNHKDPQIERAVGEIMKKL